ncbi:hypothetical protein [Aggregatilinea lenta]|uniref:hypothetical protein n=1 Tax=Aggregatilinea lenta TaxID=913108 RepID=UPI0013C377A2|nr:hypothetical protein [Aggregatilinea lenta]
MKASLRVVLSLVLVVVFVLGVTVPAAAQGPQQMPCGDLSADDCALLNGAQSALYRVSSFSVPDWSFNFSMTSDGEPVQVSGSGSAVISVPPEVTAALQALSAESTAFDYTPLLTVLEQVDSAWVEQVLAGSLFSFAVDQLSVAPADLYENPNLSGVRVVWKDGVLYTRQTSPNGAVKWFGEPFTLTGEVRDEIDAALAEFRTQMAVDLGDPAYLDSLDMMGQLAGAMEGLNAVVYQHVRLVRLADRSVDGQTLAVFEMTFDFDDLLRDPALLSALVDLFNDPAFVEMMAQDGTDYGAPAISVTEVQLLLVMLGVTFRDTSYQFQIWAGVDDGYPYHVEAAFELNMDTSLLETGTEMAGGETHVSLRFASDMADFNAVMAEHVAIPASYAPLDETDRFLVGGPEMITGMLLPGQEQDGTLDAASERDLYSLRLAAGDEVALRVDTDSFATVELYGPDGMLVDTLDLLFDDTLTFTADDAGTYLVLISNPWQTLYRVQVDVE